jgi:hypothetical protein
MLKGYGLCYCLFVRDQIGRLRKGQKMITSSDLFIATLAELFKSGALSAEQVAEILKAGK